MAKQHLAWASECCDQPAYTTPLEHLNHTLTNRVCHVVCAAPPSVGRCTSKSALWCYDAAPVYRAFAREEALRVVHLWDAPPIVLRYLRTGDESIRDAAWGAAGATAWATAWAAAGDAARTAAWAAAGAAAGAATWAAAGAAAGDSARTRQNRRLAKLLAAGRRLYGQRHVP